MLSAHSGSRGSLQKEKKLDLNETQLPEELKNHDGEATREEGDDQHEGGNWILSD